MRLVESGPYFTGGAWQGNMANESITDGSYILWAVCLRIGP